MNPRRLYRSRRDRQLAGVAGGIAEYLDVDPTVVRILWILSVFFGGFSILVYIIMAFIVPLEPVGAAEAGRAAPGGPAWGAAPAGGPAWGAPPADSATATPAEAPGGEEGDPEAEPGTEPAPGASPGAATGSPAWASSPTWTTSGQAWQPGERRPGRNGVVLGILLVVFGAIALAGVLLPGWAAWPALGPAFLVALGVALLVGATRRTDPAAES